MSLRVTGYLNGRPQYRDDGPSRARVAGYGGQALGHFTGTVLTGGPSAAARSDASRRAAETKRRRGKALEEPTP
jgi:hypothetical protein